MQQQDIPILNVPECPERIVHQRRGPIKPHSQTVQAANNNLAAPPPLTDLSSSGVIAIQYEEFFKNLSILVVVLIELKKKWFKNYLRKF